MIKAYRKKPVAFSAVQYTGDEDSFFEVQKFVGRAFIPYSFNGFENSCGIKTLEGAHVVIPGDFVIRGVQGEFYPCKADIFRQTYEEV